MAYTKFGDVDEVETQVKMKQAKTKSGESSNVLERNLLAVRPFVDGRKAYLANSIPNR